MAKHTYIITSSLSKICSTWYPVLASCGLLAVDITAHTKTRGKPFRDRVLQRLSFQFGMLWPREEKAKVGIKQHPAIQIAARTMKYHMHSYAFQGLHANINEQIVSNCIQMLQGIAFEFCSSLHRFPWFWGNLEDKGALK